VKLERAKGWLEALGNRVEAKIASGELTKERQPRARALLAKLQHRLEKLEAQLARLQEKQSARCTGAEPTSGDGAAVQAIDGDTSV
jgi:hypothetical protein